MSLWYICICIQKLFHTLVFPFWLLYNSRSALQLIKIQVHENACSLKSLETVLKAPKGMLSFCEIPGIGKFPTTCCRLLAPCAQDLFWYFLTMAITCLQTLHGCFEQNTCTWRISADANHAGNGVMVTLKLSNWQHSYRICK